MRQPIMRLPILFVVCVVAARPTTGVAQMGGGMGIGGVAVGPQVQTSPAGATRLYVKTLPPGAQVTLDGAALGQSDGLFIVPAGTKTVSVQFDGAEPQVRQVEIAEGRITRVEVSFAGNQPAGAGGGIAAAAARAQAVPRPRLTSKREPIKPKPLTAIDGALDRPLEQPLEFVETPLRDVIAGVRQVAGIDVLIDRRGLMDAGLDLDAPITAHVPAGLPLATALEMVVRERGLAWIVRDDLLEITTRERAQERLLVRVHDVADLAETADWLIIDLVQNLIAPPTWDVVGGSGSIKPDSTALVISQSLDVQRQVAGFLDVLRRLKATPAGDRRPLGVDGYWSALPAAVAARAALEKPVSVDFQETPLRHVMAQLAKEAGVPIRAERALEESVVDLDETTVTFTLEGKPLAVVLDRILEPLDLAWEVRNEGLVVTTKEHSQQSESMTVAVYPVGHLGGGDRTVGALADMMTSVVQPVMWELHGGAAVVKPVDGDVPCFVVRQSTAGHRAVHEFLESLPPSRQPGEFAPMLDSAQGMGVGVEMGFCWVAREVYGPHDPRWIVFRDWLIGDAPAWLHDLYGKHGESFAAWIRDKPAVKRVLRVLMDRVVDARPAMPGTD